MSTLAVPISARPIVYPESDGKPMAENTLQYDWIVKITGGIRRLFAGNPNVFVAGDLFWYPVEGHPEIRVAPDTLVVLGRPPGHRGSYRQWDEAGIAPQVVFEVLSPGNRFGEMSAKFDFYRRYGVAEYYIYGPDPDRLELSGFVRRDGDLMEIPVMHGYVSPLLQIKFEMHEDGLRLIGPDGRAFGTYEEVAQAEDEARRAAEEHSHEADEQRRRAEAAEQAVARERARAEQLQAELDKLR
jgi:Uma2 family endonuclease